MCCLSTKTAEQKWELADLQTSLESNRDGFGFIGIKHGKLVKSYGLTKEALASQINLYQDIPAVFHSRFATHGTKTMDQLHPYHVAADVFMAHNGVFNIDTPDSTKSDTWHMAKHLASSGGQALYNALRSPEWLQEFTAAIGTNKVAFISPSLGIIIVNEQLGHYKEGVWFSNTSYKKYVYDKGGSSSFGTYDYYGTKNNTWDNVKITDTYSFTDDEAFDSSTLFLDSMDMAESWLAEPIPNNMISGDFTLSPAVAVRATRLLVDRVRQLEERTTYLAEAVRIRTAKGQVKKAA